MKTVRLLTACAIAALPWVLSGCASTEFDDIRVEAEAAPGAELDGYSTYAWVAAAAVVRDPDAEWTPPDMDIGGEIMHLVNRELRARDMTEVVDSPDVLVIYAVGVDMKSLDVVVDSETGAQQFEETSEGAVMILLVDPETKKVAWVGAAAAELLEEPTVELAKKRLDYAITKMFEDAPIQ